MSNQSQHYEGQIQILRRLIQRIDGVIKQNQTFSVVYKQEIDKVYNQQMMMNYITPLRNIGYPAYNEKVNQSIAELKRMKATIEEFIQHLQKLIQISKQIENDLR